MVDDSETFFDVIIVGTGLTESIVAAALSKAKYKVAHIDPNSYYGGAEATLSQDELVTWGEDVRNGRHPKFSSYTGTTNILPYSRQYSICLRPSVIPSLGPLIGSLVASGVAKYSGFSLLESVNLYSSDGTVKRVPGSKEEIFKSKDLSLIKKRRLMRFLTFASGEFEEKPELEGKKNQPFADFLKSVFSLDEEISTVIAYSLAHCTTAADTTLPALLRLRKYLRSIGRYGPSPFLIGHYGGIGDISQGFCRAAAVNGAIYILGRKILSINFQPAGPSVDPSYFSLTLDDFPETLRSRLLISSRQHVPTDLVVDTMQVPNADNPPHPSVIKVARCIAIVDKPIGLRALDSGREDEQEDALRAPPPADTSILIFPPSSLPKGSSINAATALISGDASLSTPKGKWIIYIMLPLSETLSSELSARDVLQPYLDAILSMPSEPSDSPIEPMSTSFFFENSDEGSHQEPPTEVARCLITPSLNYSTFPDFPDSATLNAESLFRHAVKSLRALKGETIDDEEIDFWPPIDVENEDSDSDV